ncbi:MAG: hypothetical protein RLZZ84_1237 [Pseudomonadota bacterium]
MADDFAARLRGLEDREAIRDLIARYGPLADASDAQAVARLWTADGIYAVGGMGEARGHAAIAALIAGPVHQALLADGCAHVLGAPAIELAGDRALACCHSVVLRHADGTWVPMRVSANRWELERGADGWRVARRDNALLDGSAAARALLSLPIAPHQPPAMLL